MLRSMFQSWLNLILLFPLLEMAFAVITITYPTSDVTYPPTGPDAVGWTFSDGDPSNITIYLATYSGDKVINNLYGLTWATASGSVEITLKYPPVPGDTYTWMFYDTTVAIQLAENYIAQSAHFRVQGSTTSSTSTSTTTTTATGTGTPSTLKQTKSGLSPGATAGIAVVVTLAVVILCLLGGFCWLRRRPGWSKKTSEIFSRGKPKLDGRAGLGDPSLSMTEKIHEPGISQRATVARTDNVDDTSSSPYHEVATSFPARARQPVFNRSGSDVLPATAYEMYGESGDGHPPELPGTAPSGTIHRKELPVDNHDQFDKAPNEQQDGTTTAPQVFNTSEAVSYVGTRKPLPISHDTHLQ